MPCVQLRSARIPSIPGIIADHFWFVIDKQVVAITDHQKRHQKGHQKDRWEIWQSKDCGGESWNHLHKNLKACADNVGCGESKLIYEWFGENAERLVSCIEQSSSRYPYQNRYHYWPGPNSNTYVQWVLDKADINYMLDSSAIGKDYSGVLFSIKKHKQYFQLASPLFGFKLKWPNQFEVHFLTLAFGIRIKPLRVLVPFKREKGMTES